MSKIFNNSIGIFLILFGIYLLKIKEEQMFEQALYIGSVYVFSTLLVFLYYWIGRINPAPYVSIILSLIIGVTLFILPLIPMKLLTSTLGLGFLIATIYYYIQIIKKKINSSKINGILAIIGIFYGMIVYSHPDVLTKMLTKIISIFVIINGITYMMSNKE